MKENRMSYYIITGHSSFRLTLIRLKPKLSLWPITNHAEKLKPVKKSKPRANTCIRHKARENVCERVTIGFSFTLILTKRQSGVCLWSQFLNVVMQNQVNTALSWWYREDYLTRNLRNNEKLAVVVRVPQTTQNLSLLISPSASFAEDAKEMYTCTATVSLIKP